MPKELVKVDKDTWKDTGMRLTFILPEDWEENDTYAVAFKSTERGLEACYDTDPEAMKFYEEVVTWFVISEAEYLGYLDVHMTDN